MYVKCSEILKFLRNINQKQVKRNWSDWNNHYHYTTKVVGVIYQYTADTMDIPTTDNDRVVGDCFTPDHRCDVSINGDDRDGCSAVECNIVVPN